MGGGAAGGSASAAGGGALGTSAAAGADAAAPPGGGHSALMRWASVEALTGIGKPPMMMRIRPFMVKLVWV